MIADGDLRRHSLSCSDSLFRAPSLVSLCDMNDFSASVPRDSMGIPCPVKKRSIHWIPAEDAHIHPHVRAHFPAKNRVPKSVISLSLILSYYTLTIEKDRMRFD